ncbi:MAG TPA: hypothetical protein VFA68_01220 [Terriglobales bacterium]|nr:hypothetical protein [Terriglobales bacterium]
MSAANAGPVSAVMAAVQEGSGLKITGPFCFVNILESALAEQMPSIPGAGQTKEKPPSCEHAPLPKEKQSQRRAEDPQICGVFAALATPVNLPLPALAACSGNAVIVSENDESHSAGDSGTASTQIAAEPMKDAGFEVRPEVIERFIPGSMPVGQSQDVVESLPEEPRAAMQTLRPIELDPVPSQQIAEIEVETEGLRLLKPDPVGGIPPLVDARVEDSVHRSPKQQTPVQPTEKQSSNFGPSLTSAPPKHITPQTAGGQTESVAPRTTLQASVTTRAATPTPVSSGARDSASDGERGPEPRKKENDVHPKPVSCDTVEADSGSRPRVVLAADPVAAPQICEAVREAPPMQPDTMLSLAVPTGVPSEASGQAAPTVHFAQPAERASVGEPPPPPEVSVATIRFRADHAEMHLDVRTSAFGQVQMHTVVQNAQVGITIGSEKGDLTSYLSAEVPGMQKNLQQQDLRFDTIQFVGNGTAMGGGNPGGNSSHSRDFIPVPWQAIEISPEMAEEANPIVTTFTPKNGLNIHA